MAERSSKKQQELLQFIDDFIKEHGYGPSYREVMNGLGYKSVSTVAVHVNGLLAKGYIRKKDNSARSIEIVTMQQPSGKKPPAHVMWLEAQIAQKIANPHMNEQDVETLIQAAELLDMFDTASLRAAAKTRKG